MSRPGTMYVAGAAERAPRTAAPVRYLRIAAHFARIGVIRKSQFRAEFFAQVIMDTIWYSTHILTFEILFLHAGDIAGWSREEIRVFLGCLFISDAFMMMWMGQSWRFGMDLKDGKLDPFRVRPGATIFLYFFQIFSLEACFNMAIAASYLAYALGKVGATPGLGGALMLLWALALACWARAVTMILFSVSDIVFVNSSMGRLLNSFFGAAADRPIDIFTRRIRLFLVYVVPVALMTHGPASMILGRVGPGTGLFHTAWLSALGLFTFRLWKRLFRRYESAMG